MSEGEDVEEKKDYEVLPEDYASYDLSFKLIVIGDSGNNKLINNIYIKYIFFIYSFFKLSRESKFTSEPFKFLLEISFLSFVSINSILSPSPRPLSFISFCF